MKMQNSNCKMRNENLKFKIFESPEILAYGGKEIAKIYQKVYQEREGEDSPGGFGFKRARRINFKTLSRNF